MRRREFLKAAAVGLGALRIPLQARAAGQTDRGPNIVLIMADDLGYGDISPYGGWIETPNLDALAKAGLRFTDFHSSGNVCSPTRAGLMTGRYQQRAGLSEVLFANPQMDTHYHGMQDVEWTVGEAFKGEGYATAIFGKWHLGYLPQFNPIRHGFDRFRGFVSGNIDYVSHVDQTGRHDWWIDDQRKDEPGYLTRLVTRHAVDFIEANHERPFFLYMPHHAPHYPFQGPGDPADRRVGGEFDPRGSVTDKKRAYREMVQAMDDSVGQVVAALEKNGIRDNTMIWFLSDNGAALPLGSNAPLRGTKGTDWEGGHRVPSIANWPGRIKPGTTKELTSTIDVMPTVLALAGRNEKPARGFDGADLSGLLLRGEPVGPREIFWKAGGFFWNGAAMRDGPWKLLIDRYETEPGPPMLFNLDDDLSEKNDLAGRYPGRAQSMKAKLDAWIVEVTQNATPQSRPGAGG